MDPNATYDLWADPDTPTEEAREHAENLLEWVRKGGVHPDVHERRWPIFLLWCVTQNLLDEDGYYELGGQRAGLVCPD